jgi:hypothetical protein
MTFAEALRWLTSGRSLDEFFSPKSPDPPRDNTPSVVVVSQKMAPLYGIPEYARGVYDSTQNRILVLEGQESAIAHELFHAGQFRVPKQLPTSTLSEIEKTSNWQAPKDFGWFGDPRLEPPAYAITDQWQGEPGARQQEYFNLYMRKMRELNPAGIQGLEGYAPEDKMKRMLATTPTPVVGQPPLPPELRPSAWDVGRRGR